MRDALLYPAYRRAADADAFAETYAAYLLAMVATHYLLAPALLARLSGTYRRLQAAPASAAKDDDLLQWSNYTCSLAHSVVFFVTAVADFADLDFTCASWRSTTPFQEVCYAVMLAYLTYDTTFVFVTFARGSITLPMFLGYAAHHLLGILSYVIVLGAGQGGEFGTYIHFSELSTVFLHTRWFCVATNRSDHPATLVVSALFALTFTATRVALPAYLIAKQREVLGEWREPWRGEAVLLITLVFFALQLTWFVEVAREVQKGVLKLLGAPPTAKEKVR